MIEDVSKPILLSFKSAAPNSESATLNSFTSYNFERNILVPASAFRFTAPGVDKAQRKAIRSGDMVELWAVDSLGSKQQIATGFVDETDTHIVPEAIEYVLTGRDTLGQLVDNASVDAQNRIINVKEASLGTILGELLKNTRLPLSFVPQQMPNGVFLFQTNPGETKISALQRYLEFTNCLVWTLPSGQVKIGKPNFTQKRQGILILESAGQSNNILDARVRRNVNQAIRQIVSQLQTQDQVDAGSFTKNNNDPDMRRISPALGGRSVYRHFSYGQGQDSVNTIVGVGNQSGNPRKIGDELSLREIARDNMKILDVEAVVKGHLNENGNVYNIDQVYGVRIDDDDVGEDLYVYSCSYELTKEHGRLTRMRLCRLGTICAYADALARQ